MKADVMIAGPEAYARASTLLQAGKLVALPTETVYGLAGDATSDTAIAAIYKAKGRPSTNPLITHLSNGNQAGDFAHVNALAGALIARFWPGPLTLVLPRRATSYLADRATAGLNTIALRHPDVDWMDPFTGIRSGPLVMPSANLSGHVSPTTAQHVMNDLGDRIDLIIDGGPCRQGLESTVLAIDGDLATLLREGALPRARIETLTGPLLSANPDGPTASPGMLARHYAPQASLRLNAVQAQDGEILIGFGPDYGDPSLSRNGDLREAARNLYRLLRDLDGPDQKLAVAPIPDAGLGAAINDRLRRAALGR
jgi:L-threonylcarbamoyladenylate synthase